MGDSYFNNNSVFYRINSVFCTTKSVFSLNQLGFFSKPTQLLYMQNRLDSLNRIDSTILQNRLGFFTEPTRLFYRTDSVFFTQPSRFFELVFFSLLTRCVPTAAAIVSCKRTRSSSTHARLRM